MTSSLVCDSLIWRSNSARRMPWVATRRPAPRSRLWLRENCRSEVTAGLSVLKELLVSKRETGALMVISPPVRSGMVRPGVTLRELDWESASAVATASSPSFQLAFRVNRASKRPSSWLTRSEAMTGSTSVARRPRLLAKASSRAWLMVSSTRSMPAYRARAASSCCSAVGWASVGNSSLVSSRAWIWRSRSVGASTVVSRGSARNGLLLHPVSTSGVSVPTRARRRAGRDGRAGAWAAWVMVAPRRVRAGGWRGYS
jgi:hypothetical protein